jgi:hypothetical protein
MDPSPLKLECASSLDELVETHLQALLNRLAKPHTLHELQVDLASLNGLIDSFRRRDELLEKLIDSATPEQKRRQILETLRANRMKVEDDGSALEQLHAKSHQLLERSRLLIMKAQRLIQKEAHNNSGYRLETCNNCKGTGRNPNARCLSCKGTGTVLKQQSKAESLH